MSRRGAGTRAGQAALALTAALALGAAPVPATYRASVEAWRAEREAKLRAEDGWLAVAGLFWLRQGANSLGTLPGNDIVLPAGSAPARAGTLTLRDGRVMLRLARGVTAAGAGHSPEREIAPDGDEVVALGRLRLSVIERSGRHGLRVRDPESPRRRGFSGLAWYPVDESFRVAARFVPAAQRTIGVANVLGDVLEMPSPGQVEFTLRGRALRLDPALEVGSPRLFFIFRDTTAGRDTYPAGRYLYAEPPADGVVTLDFNRAYSPPCAFTDFATCPLPPPQNRLSVAVEAGEKKPPHP
ncbi:MAG TPA: DUF1684 domain-containing protein [Vicinamibacteria bacterium]|nr:DUF1684 domain-containing protein [Vicinamibacteria bacterium]